MQVPGALIEKAKELILFSLVLHSRCHPCFDAHYQKARELGITQAELDEAAWCAIAMGGTPVRMPCQDCRRRAQAGAEIRLPNLGRREHTAGVRWNRSRDWEGPFHSERVRRGSE